VHDTEQHDTDKAKRDEQRRRTTNGEGLARADKEAGSDGASDGNHLQMAALERPGQAGSTSVPDCNVDIVSRTSRGRIEPSGAVGVVDDGIGVALEAVEDTAAVVAVLGSLGGGGTRLERDVLKVLAVVEAVALFSVERVVAHGRGRAVGATGTVRPHCLRRVVFILLQPVCSLGRNKRNMRLRDLIDVVVGIQLG
jgi:hypothetical protein